MSPSAPDEITSFIIRPEQGCWPNAMATGPLSSLRAIPTITSALVFP